MNLKRILFILFLGLYLLSCGNKTKSEENKQEEKRELLKILKKVQRTDMEAIWWAMLQNQMTGWNLKIQIHQ